MKHVLLTFFLTGLLAVPNAMAGGGQFEQSGKKAEKQEDIPVEESFDGEDTRTITPLPSAEDNQSSSWITNLESTEVQKKNDVAASTEEKQKEVTYSNYSFLFQLFYKYSLSDFFEAPSFRNEKKNDWQGWEFDLKEQKQKASDWLNYWGRKLSQNLKR